MEEKILFWERSNAMVNLVASILKISLEKIVSKKIQKALVLEDDLFF